MKFFLNKLGQIFLKTLQKKRHFLENRSKKIFPKQKPFFSLSKVLKHHLRYHQKKFQRKWTKRLESRSILLKTKNRHFEKLGFFCTTVALRKPPAVLSATLRIFLRRRFAPPSATKIPLIFLHFWKPRYLI